MKNTLVYCVVLTVALEALLTAAQIPPRYQIPGAVLIPQNRPHPGRQQRILQQPFPDSSPVLRPKHFPNAIPIPIRPVVEEPEEDQPRGPPPSIEDEVARFSSAALQNAVRQSEEETETARPIQFRPERPLPVLRQDVRIVPSPRPTPILRQEYREEAPIPVRQAPVRQNPIRQQVPIQQPPQQIRPRPRPAQQNIEEDEDGRRHRVRKPPVQILRKYRTDNEDGSITWGFENEDGTFKEETIGADCIIRGKYGYIDPEGTKREYSYETGNKCDPVEEELPLEEEPLQPGPRPAAPRKPQYRPLPAQN